MMKKRTYSIMAAALLLASGALLTTACSNEDEAIDNNEAKTVTFTATLAPKGGATTRAITVNNQGTANETLTTTWEEGEAIGIYYETGTSSNFYASATVQTVNADGSATIIGTFPSNYMPNDCGAAKFVYPAYMMADDGSLRYDYVREGMGLCYQYGNLTGNNSISTGNGGTSSGGVCDVAIGYGTLAVNGSDVTVNGSVTMENEVCICKFHFVLDEGTGMGMGGSVEHTFSPVTINDGDGHAYTITSDRPDEEVVGMTRKFKSTDDIYVALLPISGKTVTFSYTETQSSGKVNYTCTKENVTLQKGKFYRNLGTITLTKQ